MFTLDSLDTETKQEQGAWLHLIDPATGQPAYIDEDQEKPCRVKLQGWESKAGKAVIVKARNKANRAIQKSRNGKAKAEELTIEKLEQSAEDDALALSEMALDWENILDGSGKEVPFSKEAMFNATKNILDLRQQCLKFINNKQVFFVA